jgi:hypothetical protein
MCATAQNLLRWKVTLGTLKFRAKAIVRRVSVRADKGQSIASMVFWIR